MKQLFYALRFLYRVWFYVLAAIPIILFSPLLILLAILPCGFPIIYWVARTLWAPLVLWGMGTPIKVQSETELKRGTPYMICPNHQSLLDVMIILRLSKNPVLFVGKKELQKIPIFGFIYKKVSILVDRSQKASRAQVYASVKNKLKDQYSVCIFPEGTVPDAEVLLDSFKPGAFKMAIEHQLTIVPVSLYNVKNRLPFDYNQGRPGVVYVKVHPERSTKGVEYDRYGELQEECRNLLKNDLMTYQENLSKI